MSGRVRTFLLQLADAHAHWKAQVLLVIFYAIAWNRIVQALAKGFRGWVRKKPWKKQWLDLSIKSFKSFFVHLPNDQAYFVAASTFVGVMAQHLAGGLLCAPSGLNLSSSSLAFALARHGLLSEAGWEVQDLAVRLWQLLFGGIGGRAQNPPGLLVILLLHHAMGIGLVVPCNLYLPSSRNAHEFAMLLQGAAAAAVLLQNYGYTLNVATPSGLRRMKVSVCLVWGVILYSRVIRFAVLVLRLYFECREQGLEFLIVGGMTVVSTMLYINFIFLFDATKKLFRFVFMDPYSGAVTPQRLSEAARESSVSLDPTPAAPRLQRWVSNGSPLKDALLKED